MLTLWKGSDPEPDPNWDFQDQEQNIMNLDPQPSPETNIFFIKQNAMGYLPRFHWSESRHPSRPPAARAVGIPRLRPGPAWPRLPGSYREKLRVRFSQITCLAWSVWRFLSKRTWRSVLQSRSFFGRLRVFEIHEAPNLGSNFVSGYLASKAQLRLSNTGADFVSCV